MTLQEAQILTLRVLKQVMEEKLDQHNVQLAQVRIFPQCSRSRLIATLSSPQVTKEKGFEILKEAQLSALIEQM